MKSKQMLKVLVQCLAG